MKATTTITGALTISLYILFLFSYTLLTIQLHHIIYEEIGEMLGALLYIHVTGLINISGLSHAVHQLHQKGSITIARLRWQRKEGCVFGKVQW